MLRAFAKSADSEGIADEMLLEAVRRAELGSIDAHMGSSVIKQRIARPDAGRRGGYRVLLAFHTDRHTLFLFLFAKNDRENVSRNDLAIIRETAKTFHRTADEKIEALLSLGDLIEIVEP